MAQATCSQQPSLAALAVAVPSNEAEAAAALTLTPSPFPTGRSPAALGAAVSECGAVGSRAERGSVPLPRAVEPLRLVDVTVRDHPEARYALEVVPVQPAPAETEATKIEPHWLIFTAFVSEGETWQCERWGSRTFLQTNSLAGLSASRCAFAAICPNYAVAKAVR